MSECVVRMEMPKRCYECDMADGLACMATGGVYGREVPKMIWIRRRPDWCPIICQLPEGHGRLGDLDAFEKDVSNALVYGLKEIPNEEGKQIFHVLMQEVLDNVKKRETIVPADTAERSET